MNKIIVNYFKKFYTLYFVINILNLFLNFKLNANNIIILHSVIIYIFLLRLLSSIVCFDNFHVILK